MILPDGRIVKGMILPDLHTTARVFRIEVTTEKIDTRDDTEAEFCLHLKDNGKCQMPCARTEAEIDRMWAYNLIMGKATLPEGIE